MSRPKKGPTVDSSTRTVIEYRHSYHCFLSRYAPHLLPEPSNVPPPPPPPTSDFKAFVAGDVDLRKLKLDPSNWKKQDHYLLLGLQERRHLATAAEIKAAYKKRVLVYHPDKLQQAEGAKVKEGSVEDNIFKCIFHAYQVLSDPEKRKQYDCIDANSFDDSIPHPNDIPSGDVEAFISVYGPVFKRNGRFSKKQPVPDIGFPSSPREQVEAFYSFWSNFESWRSFDYLDEDESDHAENRADKRWLEKKNRSERQKKKNEDNARLRKLFEQAYKVDPRMCRFREDDKLRKEAAKMEKEMAALKLAQQKAQEKLDAERREKEAKEAQQRREAEALQQKKETAARTMAAKKSFKGAIVEKMYFVTDLKNITVINERCILLEKFLLRGNNWESLSDELRKRMENEVSGDSIFQWIETEYNLLTQNPSNSSPSAQPSTSANKSTSKEEQSAPWSLPEIDTLINAIKTHPGGLRDRWQKITEWYNRTVGHMNSSLPRRSQEELIKQANQIRQTTDEGHGTGVLPSEATTDYKALQKKRDPRIDQAEPTNAADVPLQTPVAVAVEGGWSAEEQKRLEQGLKVHKADDPARWEKISAFVGKSKRDCMLRAKEIAMALKQKKATS